MNEQLVACSMRLHPDVTRMTIPLNRIIQSSQRQKRASQSLTRKQRLIRASAFNEIYAQNQRFTGRFMVLWFGRGEEASLRLGVVASKRVGKAVDRNRAKRRLREAFRLNRHQFQENNDIVLIARRAILKAKWKDIENELLTLANRAGLLRTNELLSRT